LVELFTTLLVALFDVLLVKLFGFTITLGEPLVSLFVVLLPDALFDGSFDEDFLGVSPHATSANAITIKILYILFSMILSA